MSVISSKGNYIISSNFGSSIVEGTNSIGANGIKITFDITQVSPVYKSFYWQIEPITGNYSDFWDTTFSNKIGGEPADAFATSGYTSKDVELRINPDSTPEQNQTFKLAFYQSVLDPSKGIAPLTSAIFTIGDDDRIASDGSHVNQLAFGSITHYSGDAGAQVYAIYSGLLGRTPDTVGLQYWSDQFEHGVAPATLTAAFLASAEGQSRLGSADDAVFVQQLYQNTLHRSADSGGLAYWTDQLAHGSTRVDVADSFVFSNEHIGNLQSVFDTGLFVPDAQASEVARIYYTMLGRAPDASGLHYWTDQIEHGGTASSVAQAFLGTPESQSTYGSLSNASYVDALYVNALGRHADSGGLNYWTGQLDHGTSRADLGVQLSQSAEAQSVHLSQIEQGWHLA